jgi:hypothetical protein
LIINQFALYAVPGLRLAENILDDGFAGFWISANRVPSLPASVFALSDISLTVCSSLWHGTFAFTGESGLYTLGFRRKIAHSGSQGQTSQIEDGLQHGQIVVHTVIQPTVCCFL